MKKETIFSNLIWRFAERFGAKFVEFIVSMVLARLLAPDVYGTIALITVFTTVLNVFVDSGLGNALIQKKEADNLDFSTVFYFNILICCVLYAGMFLAAPYIAEFYNDYQLTIVIRVLSLTLVISGVKNVQQAYVSRTMQFRRFFFATLGGTMGAAILGILIAYLGGGVWALVVQQLFNAAVDTLILWFTVKWRPEKSFSFHRLKGLLSYGWKLLASALIDTVYNDLRQLIIGKMYSPSDLAYYNQGKKFPSFIVTNIDNSISSVLLPAMSRVQEHRERVRDMTRRTIRVSTFVMAPVMMGLAFCAEPVVLLLLTEKWLPCVPYLRIFCITHMFYPIHTANLNAINAMGRSDLFLKLEIIKKIVGVALLLSSMWFGVLAMAYSLLLSSVISQIINSWPNWKLLNYSYINQLKDILPGIILAVGMGACVHALSLIPLPALPVLVMQTVLGAVIYLGGARLIHLEAYDYLYETVKPILKRLVGKG